MVRASIRSLLCLCVLLALAPAPSSAQAAKLPAGPLATNGSQIVGADGQPVRILGVGTWIDVSDRVGAIAEAGFNTLRLEWSNRTLQSKLPELDRVVAAAGRVGLKVILDDHNNEGINAPCYASQANGLWYDAGGASDGTDGCRTPGQVTDARFIADWTMVARHFNGSSTVIGYDLWNEPAAYSGMSTWKPGSRDPTHNIRYMYERAGNAILAIDPSKLIICEGPQQYHRSFAYPNVAAPGGDLSLAGQEPVVLAVDHRLVYSVHDYPTEIAGYKPDSGPEKVAQMNKIWGYLVARGIAPVWIGEMGANMILPNDTGWAHTLIDYLNGRLGTDGGPTFTASQKPIGTSWWWAGYAPDAGNQPSGIFNADGSINTRQQAVYSQLK